MRADPPFHWAPGVVKAPWASLKNGEDRRKNGRVRRSSERRGPLDPTVLDLSVEAKVRSKGTPGTWRTPWGLWATRH